MKAFIAAATVASFAFQGIPTAQAAGDGWSIVPYAGFSQLGDQNPTISGAGDIVDGELDVSVESGFTAGLGVRYGYKDSPWTSEFGWEYRSNDSDATSADGTALPGGNYASNIFYLNGRYALRESGSLTPWIGGGITWIQEVDLDSEDSEGERSFSASGSVGFQAMVGVDYELSDRFYFTSELRYSNLTDLTLDQEGGNGQVNGIDYQPLTLGIGVGIRL
ncbi:MAG: outer membrane beta-barrel protein [Gammaproteobacteria bacterium]|nr:outer membrane beta-barrel protein [Gammaproteobacteria bacterium]